MTTTFNSLPENYSPEENAVIFFRNVKRDMGIGSTKQLVQIVGKVLSQLGRGMSPAQAKIALNRLPEIFHPLLLKNWTGKQSGETFVHLDELVESIYEDDRKSANALFSTEVEVLNAVVIILRKLDKYLNLFSHNILQHQLVEGLRQIPLEDAA